MISRPRNSISESQHNFDTKIFHDLCLRKPYQISPNSKFCIPCQFTRVCWLLFRILENNQHKINSQQFLSPREEARKIFSPKWLDLGRSQYRIQYDHYRCHCQCPFRWALLDEAQSISYVLLYGPQGQVKDQTWHNRQCPSTSACFYGHWWTFDAADSPASKLDRVLNASFYAYLEINLLYQRNQAHFGGLAIDFKVLRCPYLFENFERNSVVFCFQIWLALVVHSYFSFQQVHL